MEINREKLNIWQPCDAIWTSLLLVGLRKYHLSISRSLTYFFMEVNKKLKIWQPWDVKSGNTVGRGAFKISPVNFFMSLTLFLEINREKLNIWQPCGAIWQPCNYKFGCPVDIRASKIYPIAFLCQNMGHYQF